MNYLIVEQQTNNGTTSVLTTTKSNINEAENKYHTVLAAAAISQVDVHSAALLNERGQFIKYECFDHTEPEENVE